MRRAITDERRMAPIPVEAVKKMDMSQFCDLFDNRVVESRYSSLATVLGLVKAFKGVDDCDGRDPGDINADLKRDLDDGFAQGLPIVLKPGEGRGTYLINYQYYEHGELKLRTITFESWGIKAFIFKSYKPEPKDVLFIRTGKYLRGD